MPIYAYQCDQCQTPFEIRVSFQEKENGLIPVCPKCQSSETHQEMTVGFFGRSGSSDSASLPSSCCGPNSGAGCCGG